MCIRNSQRVESPKSGERSNPILSERAIDLNRLHPFGLLPLGLGLGDRFLGLSDLLSSPLIPLLGSLKFRRVLDSIEQS